MILPSNLVPLDPQRPSRPLVIPKPDGPAAHRPVISGDAFARTADPLAPHGPWAPAPVPGPGRELAADTQFRAMAGQARTAEEARRVGEAAARLGLAAAADFAFGAALARAWSAPEAIAVARHAAAMRQDATADRLLRQIADRATGSPADLQAVVEAARAHNLPAAARYAEQLLRQAPVALPPVGLPAAQRDDALARQYLAAVPVALARRDVLGADTAVRMAAILARSPRLSAKAGEVAALHDLPGASAFAYEVATKRVDHWADAMMIAGSAATNEARAAADGAYRRAVDLAPFAQQARRLAAEAQQYNVRAAAGYALQRAAVLPIAPPPPPKPPSGK